MSSLSEDSVLSEAIGIARLPLGSSADDADEVHGSPRLVPIENGKDAYFFTFLFR